MLTNSLFLDFLIKNKLKISKYGYTKDLICLEFDYGSKSFNDDCEHFQKILNEIDEQLYELDEEHEMRKDLILKKERVNQLYSECKKNHNKYKKLNRNELRTLFYTEGVTIHYFNEDIKYRMLYRTPGKAKKGTCMFICERLYEKAKNFLYMGIELPEENTPIVEIGAYSSLITSTIIDKIQIKTNEILVLDDVISTTVKDVISIEIDDNKQCHAIKRENYKVSNDIFDGQALIDKSIFPEWANGYILLRHHMCKMAAFNSNIQLFMKDYFKDEYETAYIKDCFGNKVKVTDIKLITTKNALKWLKFNISYSYWKKWVRKNDCYFGIVKTAHESKFGDVQRMSYQMVNCLNINTIEDVCKYSVDYINELKNNDDAFIEYLKHNVNFSNDFDVLVALVEHNPDFVNSEYFRDRKISIINSCVKILKTGRVFQDADNLTLVGSPYAMLLHSVGEDALKDPTFEYEDDCIQCYTERFDDGEYLAEFRNPFNGKNNLGYLHNHKHELLQKYFNLGNLCIAVNCIGTDFEDRNNGSDFDSDSIFTTAEENIVKHAKMCYKDYPTIVNNIPQEKNIYNNTLENFALIDNKLAASQRAIGESSNLAQIALTYTYNFNNQKYKDIVCILSVLAQIAIDSAKRTFDVDVNNEIRRLKKELDVENNGYPAFWLSIKSDFNRAKINFELECPMNSVNKLKFNNIKPNTLIPNIEFFNKEALDVIDKM